MKLGVLKESFSVCKVASYEGVDLDAPFVFTGATDMEKSLVCPTDRVPDATLAREDGWRAFRIEGQLDFSLVGILARISSILAAEKIGIFAVSTFDTDYILVKAENLERALVALARAGYETGDGEQFHFVSLREAPALKTAAAAWFHAKWGVPEDAYLKCMDAYLSGGTEYGWYLCLDGERIVGGLGVIENDFHERKDLSPNICAVYVEESHRRHGIAGRLLDMAVEDLRGKGISPVYLLTDHTGFYERYGWEFLCPVRGDGEEKPSRMYIHR